MSRLLTTSVAIVLVVTVATALAFTVFVPDGLTEPLPIASWRPMPDTYEPGGCACLYVPLDGPETTGQARSSADNVQLASAQLWTPDYIGICGGYPQAIVGVVAL